jgi:2-dehydropantoate 2-reductase
MEPPVKVCVIGTGAIGGYYGFRLNQAGAELHTVCRSDYQEIRENGLTVHTGGKTHTVHPAGVYRSMDECPPVDYCIIATKVLPGLDRAALLGKTLSPETTIVLIQNGINIEEPIAQAFPENTIISCLAFICVTRTSPGVIEHLDYGRLVIGKFPEGGSERVDILARLFDSAGVNCTIDENIIQARWKKLVWNAPFNPLSVLAGGVDTREMLTHEEMIATVRRVMEEVVEIATAAGHPIGKDFIESMIADTGKMTPYRTSMLVDYENGRPMEVDAILGEPLRTARNMNVKVPVMQTLHSLLDMVDRKNRDQ